MAKEIFSIKTIKEKKFQTLDLCPEYAYLMGYPEKRFTGIHYGQSGSGKSVLTLQFADYFARNFGEVLYNSHEEKISQTIQDRINNFNIDADKLYVANGLSFDRMCHYIQRNYYRLVIIDSVDYMKFTVDQLKELRAHFAKRLLSVIMVDFGKTEGNPKSGYDLIHASDVKLFFKNGRVHSTSRYLDQPVEKHLFTPKKAKTQPTLFD